MCMTTSLLNICLYTQIRNLVSSDVIYLFSGSWRGMFAIQTFCLLCFRGWPPPSDRYWPGGDCFLKIVVLDSFLLQNIQVENLSDCSIKPLFSSSQVLRSATIQLMEVELRCAKMDSRLLVRFVSVLPIVWARGCLQYILLMSNHRNTKMQAEICDSS